MAFKSKSLRFHVIIGNLDLASLRTNHKDSETGTCVVQVFITIIRWGTDVFFGYLICHSRYKWMGNGDVCRSKQLETQSITSFICHLYFKLCRFAVGLKSYERLWMEVRIAIDNEETTIICEDQAITISILTRGYY